MANRAKKHNRFNHDRQVKYLKKGIVMLPTKLEEILDINTEKDDFYEEAVDGYKALKRPEKSQKLSATLTDSLWLMY